MSVLSDKEIRNIIQEKNAVYVEEGPELDLGLQLGPSSFDLRLGYEFGVLNTRKLELVDTKNMGSYKDFIKKEEHKKTDGVVIHPGEFILGGTIETVNVPDDLVARVEGRSSYGRLGIIIHATAGYIDPGFEGDITLEMQNLGNAPVKVYPEDRICQIVFEEMTGRAEKTYGEKHDTKYMGQEGATSSRLDREKR
ncbi:MAG: dCTP deaminase [Candidatus Nanohaloarchaeota archaeon QJJ-9]|nr:dCTP deaminase [Candidatus Nanohaloarchaeota archaeon QJJ-9]